jgi:hypothetical protein
VTSLVTDLYHKLQKGELFDGLQRTYQPRNEDGEPLPPESKNPQLRVSDAVTSAAKAWQSLFDTIATLDSGNCTAFGELRFGGSYIPDVPVTTLLFLEKQLADIKTFVSKLPTLDPAETWSFDSSQSMHRTETKRTARTKKVQRPIVLFPATEQHPAQTQLITEDVIAGDWSQINYSTRITAKAKEEMLERVSILCDAVKTARERANATEIQRKEIGAALLTYVFGSLANI